MKPALAPLAFSLSAVGLGLAMAPARAQAEAAPWPSEAEVEALLHGLEAPADDAAQAVAVQAAAPRPAALAESSINETVVPAPPPPHADQVLALLASMLADGPAYPRAEVPRPAMEMPPLEEPELLQTDAPVTADSLLPPLPTTVSAAPPPAVDHPVALAVDDNRLDRMRGGFSLPGGLQVSFGIERAVYLNGVLVTSTSLTLNGLDKVAGGPPGVDATAALVQLGASNSLAPGGLPPGSAATVIQNSLDNQKLQTLTVVNATVNSLAMLKAMQLQRSIDDAIVDSLRR